MTKMRAVTFMFVFIVLLNSNVVRTHLVLDKRCGQISCDRHEFCSPIDQTCKNCADICQKDQIHKLNAEACSQGCQDYLHDITYVRRDDEGSSESLKEEVRQLRTTLTATLTLVVLILIGILIVLSIQAVKWCKNNKILKQKFRRIFLHKKTEVTAADAKTISNPNVRLSDEGKPVELRLDMNSTRGHSDLPTPATLSTNISRRPAEDSTLDYAAYDNPAMRMSGSSHGGSPGTHIGINRDRTY